MVQVNEVGKDSLPGWLLLTLEAGPMADNDRFYLEGIPTYENVDKQYYISVTSPRKKLTNPETELTSENGLSQEIPVEKDVFTIQVGIVGIGLLK